MPQLTKVLSATVDQRGRIVCRLKITDEDGVHLSPAFSQADLDDHPEQIKITLTQWEHDFYAGRHQQDNPGGELQPVIAQVPGTTTDGVPPAR